MTVYRVIETTTHYYRCKLCGFAFPEKHMARSGNGWSCIDDFSCDSNRINLAKAKRIRWKGCIELAMPGTAGKGRLLKPYRG
jgi:hypothetical protein